MTPNGKGKAKNTKRSVKRTPAKTVPEKLLKSKLMKTTAKETIKAKSNVIPIRNEVKVKSILFEPAGQETTPVSSEEIPAVSSEVSLVSYESPPAMLDDSPLKSVVSTLTPPKTCSALFSLSAENLMLSDDLPKKNTLAVPCLCIKCEKPVETVDDGFNLYGAPYHRSCLLCEKCQSWVGINGFTMGEHMLDNECFDQEALACAVCKAKRGTEAQTTTPHARQFYEQCSSCIVCKRSLMNEYDGKVGRIDETVCTDYANKNEEAPSSFGPNATTTESITESSTTLEPDLAI